MNKEVFHLPLQKQECKQYAYANANDTEIYADLLLTRG